MSDRGPRSAGLLAFLGLLALLAIAGLVALGTWQVERRAWKLDLIERVGQRVHAAPVDLPSVAGWPQVNAASDEYLHVQATGSFLHDRETFVQAVTHAGSGFWVLTPLQRADGSVVLVNRGFVPPEGRSRATRSTGEPAGEVRVTGLLRLSEPAGGFLRKNDPAGGRWYSRDVQAIAAARGLTGVAPFFIDADASQTAAPAGQPMGGLTVVDFHNNHAVYAITWFVLAALVAGAAWRVAVEERRLRRRRRAMQADSAHGTHQEDAQQG